MKILVAEKERPLSDQLVRHLESEAYAVDSAHDGRRATELAEINRYDLIVLDEALCPNRDMSSGRDASLLRRWRLGGVTAPIFMLATEVCVDQTARLLDEGADDCLPKPVDPTEFLARVRCLLRRTAERPRLTSYRAGDLRMDRADRRVRIGSREVPLSPKEFALLELLLRRRDCVVTRAEIEEHVWDSSFDSFSNIVNVFIYRLRKKIDGNATGKLLQTVPGQGYVLRSERR